MKRFISLAIVALAVAALVIVSGCSSSTPAATPSAAPPATSGSSSSAAPAAGGSAVTIANFAFSPAELTVKVGDTVTWTNNDNVPHTVTGTGWDLGQVAPGSSVSHKFTAAGSFTYKCTIHPSMSPGTITVK